MSNNKSENLLSEREHLLHELCALQNLVHGSIFEKYDVCSRPDCKCHSGEKHGPHACFKVNIHGRQTQKYIPKSKRKDAENAIYAYKRAIELLDRISAINIEFICSKKQNE